MASQAAAQEAAKLSDLKDDRVPSALQWTVEQVADWIEELGFQQYKPCFTTNMITGRKLIAISASAFPHIGITDFDHIKIIARSIRDLLTLEEPNWSRSIARAPRSDIGLYLEQKSERGKMRDKMSYQLFLQGHHDSIWRPPLSNQCQLLPVDTPPGVITIP